MCNIITVASFLCFYDYYLNEAGLLQVAAQEKIFHLIDALLRWEGQFDASDLMDLVSLSSGALQSGKAYKEQFPNHCTYNSSLKNNIVRDSFTAHHWQDNCTLPRV